MNIKETTYIGRDNVIILALSVDGITVDHRNFTRVQLDFGVTLLDSLLTPSIVDFTQQNKVTFYLGKQNIPAGKYPTKLYLYDLDNLDGVAWGTISFTVSY
jgi:hypothetical protein